MSENDVSTAITGLTTVNATDIEATDLQVDNLLQTYNLNVSNDGIIQGDLTVLGSFYGPSWTGGTGSFQYLNAGTGSISYLSFGSLTGPTGTIGSLNSNEIRTPLVYNPDIGGVLTLGNSSSNDLVQFNALTTSVLGGNLFVGRSSNQSRIVLNSNSASGATGGMGMYIRDDPGEGLFSIAKAGVVSNDRLSYEWQAPANQQMTVQMKPKSVIGATTTQVLLQDPFGSSQTINSNLQVNGDLSVSGTISGTLGAVSATSMSAGTGSFTNLSFTTATGAYMTVQNMTGSNIAFTNTLSGPTGIFTNVSFTNATGSNLTVQNISGSNAVIQNMTGGTIAFSNTLSGPTGSFTNLGFTNATGSNLTVQNMTGSTIFSNNISAGTGSFTAISGSLATITGTTYNSIPGNLTTAWAFNAGSSTISYEGLCHNNSWVVAYGLVGCNGTAQSIQLHNLDGTLSSTYLNVPTTCATNMAFAILYNRSTGAPTATFRIPRTTSGGAGFLDAKISSNDYVYLVGYFNNTVTGQTFEGWNQTSSIQTIPTSATQIPVVIALNASDQTWVQVFTVLPNNSFSSFDRVAIETDSQIVVAGQYRHSGSNLTIGSLSIPPSTTTAPFMVYLNIDEVSSTVRNMWWAFNNQSITFYLRELTFVSTNLYLYMSLTSPSALNLTDFNTSSPATVRGTVVDTGGGNYPFVLRWQRTTSPYLFGFQMMGRAYVNASLAPEFNNAGRMVYNPINNYLYITGKTTTNAGSVGGIFNYCTDALTFSNTPFPFKALKVATGGNQSAGFLGAFDMATNTLVGISPLLVESPLYTTRGDAKNSLGAMYVDDLGNLYVQGKLEFNNGTSNNSQDTPIDISIRLRTNSRYTLRDISTTNMCVSSFIIKLDSSDRIVGYSQLNVQSTDTAFAVNGFATAQAGSKLVVVCANPQASSDLSTKGHNFNDTYSGINLPTAVTPTRALGLSYDIKVLSQTVIGNGGISVGWNPPLSSSTDALYQRLEEAQIKTSGSIVSGTSLVTPAIYSLNKQEPNSSTNIIPTLQIQPQGGRVNIGGSDFESSQIGNRVSVGNGLVSSTQINTTRPFQRFGQGFSDCLYYWFGGDDDVINTSAEIYLRQSLAGAVTQTTTYWGSRWNNVFMFELQNMTRDDTAFSTLNVYNPTIPTNYARWQLPVDSRCDTAVFVAAIARDRWSVLRCWLCNFSTGVPVVMLGEDSTSCKLVGGASPDAGRNSSFFGPFNTHARTWASTYMEWLQFNIPQRFLTNSTYCQGGEVKIAIQNRLGNDSATVVYISGLATAPNPLSIQQRKGWMDVNRMMSVNSATYNTDNNFIFVEEWVFLYNTANKIIQFYFNLSEFPAKTDYILTWIGHGNTWESPQMEMYDVYADKENRVWRRGGGPTAQMMHASGLYRNLFHCYLTADQVSRMYVATTNNNFLYSFRMKVTPPGWNADVGVYGRGWILERAYPLTTLE